MTEMQLGLVLGLAGGIIVFLAVMVLHWRRQGDFWRDRALAYREEAERASRDYRILTHQFKNLKMQHRECVDVDLTPAELDYLHRSLGLKPPA